VVVVVVLDEVVAVFVLGSIFVGMLVLALGCVVLGCVVLGSVFVVLGCVGMLVLGCVGMLVLGLVVLACVGMLVLGCVGMLVLGFVALGCVGMLVLALDDVVAVFVLGSVFVVLGGVVLGMSMLARDALVLEELALDEVPDVASWIKSACDFFAGDRAPSAPWAVLGVVAAGSSVVHGGDTDFLVVVGDSVAAPDVFFET